MHAMGKIKTEAHITYFTQKEDKNIKKYKQIGMESCHDTSWKRIYTIKKDESEDHIQFFLHKGGSS